MLIKKIVYFGFIIFALFIINDLVHSIFSLWQKSDMVALRQRELAIEKKKNEDLKKQIKSVHEPQFVEEEARNKLFMVKPGEGIVVVAPTEYLKPKSLKNSVREIRPNWQQWWETFF